MWFWGGQAAQGGSHQAQNGPLKAMGMGSPTTGEDVMCQAVGVVSSPMSLWKLMASERARSCSILMWSLGRSEKLSTLLRGTSLFLGVKTTEDKGDLESQVYIHIHPYTSPQKNSVTVTFLRAKNMNFHFCSEVLQGSSPCARFFCCINKGWQKTRCIPIFWNFIQIFEVKIKQSGRGNGK